jgi:predicted XRE-type DNA-binding protein
MSTPPSLGRYHFQAWARRGIGLSITNVDSGTLPDRASLDVQVSLDVQGGLAPNPVLPPSVTVQLYGPGDIAAIDPRMVIRTEPREFTVNFEPNYLCGIEFDVPDFPWTFTPAAPNGDRLHPWIALIVLQPGEFTYPSTAPNPLPTISVLTGAPLQNLSTSWNWAHVQISGEDSLTDVLATAPGNAISRLLCPRRLDPETSYTAFVVPAFAIGVQAGLGQDVSGVATADPAWTNATAYPLTLPYYYRFDFHTSDQGDFESLVRALTPRVLPGSVGQRPLDVSQPDPGIPSAGPPLGLDGALHSVATHETVWADPAKTAFQTAIQAWINQTSPATDDPANPNPGDPVVVPPIYGQWAAAIRSVDRTAVGWENDLNLDPRNRSAAGMGTEIVQNQVTQLMASAWAQVADVLKANQMLAQAQLARAVSQQIYRQHLVPAQAETVLDVTSPLFSRLRASPMTITSLIRSSRVPDRMLTPGFHKLAQLPRHLGLAAAGAPTLLSRVNSGAISIVPVHKPPGGMTSIDQVSEAAAPKWAETLLKWWRWILLAIIVVALIVAIVVGVTVSWIAAAVIIVAVAGAIGAAWAALSAPLATAKAASEMQFASFTPSEVAAVPPRPGFAITSPGAPQPAGGSGTTDSPEAAAFRTATSQLFTDFHELPANPGPAPSLDIAQLKSTILTRIDPVTTVPARMGGLITLAPGLGWAPADPLQPIMAAPSFPQPMYAPLRDLDPDYLLPGVEQVPPDTVGLLESDHAFIEAYMVGLNHEMARQLLWNGYPTDQRGSYFRQFWDVSAYVRQPGDPTDPAALAELLKDIPPINTWPLPVPLGDHPNRTGIAPNNVVLLVRGELFKRYPNAIIYAGKAKLGPDGTRVLDDTDERYPLYRGTISPDMTFLGFNLSESDARGGTTASPEGFFFVFQEQPSEPRFGLEPTPDVTPVPHWSELAWTNFATAATPTVAMDELIVAPPTLSSIIAHSPWREASQLFRMVLASYNLPAFLSPAQQPTGIAIVSDPDNPDDTDNKWGVNAAETAYILLRLPFRILIHADLMLPS